MVSISQSKAYCLDTFSLNIVYVGMNPPSFNFLILCFVYKLSSQESL